MRTFRNLARRSKENELEMTPMIDVTFLLLIFFMCTLRFKTLEGVMGAHLPKDVGPTPVKAQPPPEPVEVVIEVIRPGTRLAPDGSAWSGEAGRRYVFSHDRVLEYRIGPWSTQNLDQLQARLAIRLEAHERLQEQPVRAVVDPLSGTTNGDVMGVLDRLAGAGFEQVALVGARDD